MRTAECAVFGAEGSVALARAQAEGRIERRLAEYPPFEIQLHRIGDTALLGWPGECFIEYPLEVKRRAARPVHIATLVNGELQGYIVTPENAAEGGYEATNAVFSPEAGRIFVEESLKLLDA